MPSLDGPPYLKWGCRNLLLVDIGSNVGKALKPVRSIARSEVHPAGEPFHEQGWTPCRSPGRICRHHHRRWNPRPGEARESDYLTVDEGFAVG